MGTPGGALLVATLSLIISIGSLIATIYTALRRERLDKASTVDQAIRESLQRISDSATKVIGFNPAYPNTFAVVDDSIARLILEQKTPGSAIFSDKDGLRLLDKASQNLSEVRDMHRHGSTELEDAEIVQNYFDNTVQVISLVYMVAVKNAMGK